MMASQEQTRVVHHATRTRRWKMYVRVEGGVASYGAFSRLASITGSGGWIPEPLEQAPTALMLEARKLARRHGAQEVV